MRLYNVPHNLGRSPGQREVAMKPRMSLVGGKPRSL